MAKRAPYLRWTLEEEAELRLLWEEGVRGEALATAFGRTPSAVVDRARLLGLMRQRY